jgi:peptidoglycan hydrolase FlgJ
VTIRPPSDIVLEAAQAADPARLAIAMRKLDATGAGTAFADALHQAGAERRSSLVGDVAGRLAAMAWPAGAGATEARAPYRKLEAFLLQSFLQTMIPDSRSVLGRGMAASVHKSMLAEHLADQLVRAGGIGIAAKLAAHPHGGEA